MDYLEQRAKALVKKLLQLYLGQGEMEELLSFLSPDVQWCGIGKKENGRGKQTVEKLLRSKKRDFPASCLHNLVLEAEPLSSSVCLVSGSSELMCIGEPFSIGALQITAACRMTSLKLELCQLHLSLNSLEPRFGPEKNPLLTLKEIVQQKSREVQERERDLELLTDNVPGGILRCLFDPPLTILQISGGFVSMFGYSREELQTVFHNSFWEMIDPRDREPSYSEATAQLAVSTQKRLEYRVTCKNGETIWVLDKGQLIRDENGTEYFCCILIDITKEKLAQEALAVSLERHKIIMEQSNDIIFEWNLLTDKWIFSTNWDKKFGYTPNIESSEQLLDPDSPIFQEDHWVARDLLGRILNGTPYLERELRVRRQSENFIWCKVRATTLFNQQGEPTRAVGVLIDIDHEKKQSQSLLEKAEKDALTGLYNKMTAQSLIADLLGLGTPDTLSTLMIVDIDNFKLVNDTLGHLCGDAVLTEVAQAIRKQFRNSDIIGRIGGDEFIVFMQDISNRELAEQKALLIIEAIHSIPIKGSEQLGISCSIGIAFAPEQGHRLEDLYQKADIALYCAKRQGKNQFVSYGSTTADEYNQASFLKCSAINEQIDSNENLKVLNTRLAEYVFRILYKSIHVENAVSSILEIVGKQFDVSRVYIFENSDDKKSCSNTFEWCHTGIAPEIQNLQNIGYEGSISSYQNNFDQNGIFYCKDIDLLPPNLRDFFAQQGIKAVLQCCIMDDGEMQGFVGFDECRSSRYWTQEQIDSLSFISEILSTFLLKKRAKERVAVYAEGLRTLLDNQNSWIYVINPDTYEMLYINLKTQQLVPEARVGMRCYEAYFGRAEPCELCPARQLSPGRHNCTMEIYNPILDLWTSADASSISWYGKKAILLSCHDISKYKK